MKSPALGCDGHSRFGVSIGVLHVRSRQRIGGPSHFYICCVACNNMPKACLHQEIVRALGLGLRGAKRRRCRLRIRGQIAPAVLSRHSSLKKHRLVPSPLRGRGAFGAVLRASRAILTRLYMYSKQQIYTRYNFDYTLFFLYAEL